MKYLFAVPPSGAFETVGRLDIIPYGIAIVATVAKKAGLDVYMHLVNDEFEQLDLFTERMVQRIRSEKIEVVCFGGMSWEYNLIKKMLRVCSNEKCLTVLGGSIVDSMPEVIVQNIGADFCVIGEGEETFKELAFALNENRNDLSNINGLIYKQNGKIIRTEPRNVIHDLDTLPYIDDELINLGAILKLVPVLNICGSRSCLYNCTFCYHLKGAYYRSRGLDHVFGEIDYLLVKYRQHNIKRITFFDEMICTEKERLLDFCARIKKYNLQVMIQGRLDTVDAESLSALKAAGCYRISYGIESASNKVLKSMKKNLTVEMINEKLDLTVKHGIQTQGNVILGDIEDDIESVNESLNWMMEKNKTCDIFASMISVFPGTALYNHAKEIGIINDEVDFLERGCPLINISKLTNEQFELVKDKAKNYNMAKELIYKSLLNKGKEEFAIKKDGTIQFTGYCPKCYTKVEFNNLRNTAEYNRCHIGCPECKSKLSFVGINLFERSSTFDSCKESDFHKYTNKRIAIWGISSPITREMLLISQTLRNSIVKVVDMNYESHRKETYCGLTVDPITTFNELSVDYIFVGSEVDREAITLQIREMGINVPIIDTRLVVHNAAN